MKKMDDMIRKIADKQSSIGYPVSQDGRIDQNQFVNVSGYGESVIKQNLAKVEEYKKKYTNNNKIGGELMEKVTMALFNKFFPGLTYSRTNEFDDYGIDYSGEDSNLFKGKKGVDGILAINGVVIAVIDTFLDDVEKNNPQAEYKINKVNKINNLGGGKLVYCFRKTKEGLSLRPEINIPAFYLILKSETMDRAIDRFELSSEASDAEKIAMYKMIDSIYEQISILEIKLSSKSIAFNSRLNGEKNFAIRLKALKKHLETNLPRETVQAYLKEQVEKSKTGRSKKNPR